MLVTNKSASARREPKIVAHNHPSGNLNPSESDIKITTKIKEAGNLLDYIPKRSIMLTFSWWQA
jgi:DNA repair protein RadC